MKPFLLLLSLTSASFANELPPSKPMATAPVNIFAGGPPIPSSPPAESAHPASIPLWPEGAPGSAHRRHEPENISWRQEADLVFPVISNIHQPSLTPFLPEKNKATGCAVIIAPGGGGMQLTIDREGYDVARWLAERGIAAFVLKYRLRRDISTPPGTPQPYSRNETLMDWQRAIRLVHARAAEWNVKPDCVGYLGFSAGGEIVGARLDVGRPDAPDPVDRHSSRPDFLALVYPGGLGRANLTVSKETMPPTFLICSYDDNMPEQMANLFVSLRKAGVNAELHIYSSGGHGFGVRADRPNLPVSTWHHRFTDWLGDRGFLRTPSL